MNETSKCHQKRLRDGEFDHILTGRIIDIGCGPDPIRPPRGEVTLWDIGDGRAELMEGVPDGSFDVVYSSHCLEHMTDIPLALSNWTRILKPGGWLYVVVPDYLYYEKLRWPSRFNPDHKHSFSMTLTRGHIGRKNHWNISADLWPLLVSLGVPAPTAALEIDGFDFNRGDEDQTRGDALSQIRIVGQKQ